MTVTLSESAQRGVEEIQAIRNGAAEWKPKAETVNHLAETAKTIEPEPLEAVATMACDTCRTCRAFADGRCYKFVFLTGKSGTPERTTEGRIACDKYQRARRYRAGAAGIGLEGEAIQ